MLLPLLLLTTMGAPQGILLPTYGTVSDAEKRNLNASVRAALAPHVDLLPESETIAQLQGAQQLGMCPVGQTSCPLCNDEDLRCLIGVS